MADCFIDTNIFLYAVKTNPAEDVRIAVAQTLLKTRDWAWSAQVAAEFIRASTAARQRQPLSRQEAQVWVKAWTAFPMAVIDGALVLEAAAISERFQIGQFDAQIIAAARRLTCPVVYSEDLNHGQDYGGVMVVNPFRPFQG